MINDRRLYSEVILLYNAVMTLSQRNIFIKVSLAFSIVLAVCAITLGVLLLTQLHPNLVLYEKYARDLGPQSLSSKSWLNGSVVLAVIQNMLLPVLSIFILTAIYLLFEKTYVIEISFFIFFALLCTLEGIKLVIPAFRLWEAAPDIVLLISKALFFLRLLVLFLLVLAAIFIITSFSRRILLALFTMSFLAFAITVMTPFNTGTMQFNFLIQEGMHRLNVFAYFFFIAVLFLIYFIAGKTLGSKDYVKASWSIALMLIGYFFCVNTSGKFVFPAANALLIFGTIFYLKSIHSHHLWR